MTNTQDSVIDAALTGDIESSALVALNHIANHTSNVSDPEDVIAVYVAGRVARGKQVTAEAMCDLGARYLALLDELAKQVDARMSAERDLVEASKAAPFDDAHPDSMASRFGNGGWDR